MEQKEPCIEIAEKLSEARFQFALKCLQIVKHIKPWDNVVFSPYGLYEGLLMVYFASSGDTEIHLRRILQLPESIPKQDWMSYHQRDRNMMNWESGYYEENCCWIKSFKDFKYNVPDLFNPNKWRFFDCSIYYNIMLHINEVLRSEMAGYIRQPVKLDGLNKNMEFILSSALCFKGEIFHRSTSINLLMNKFFERTHLLKEPTTVLSPKLSMFVTEVYVEKTQSLFLLFPALQSYISCWQIDNNISGLVERLTTKEGIDELRKVLDNEESSTEKLSSESKIYPDFFELENELPMDQLLEILGIRQLLEPHHSNLSNFTHENLHLGGAIHRAYIKVTSENVIAGAVNVFFTQNQCSFKSIEKIDNYQFKNSFVLLIYDRCRHDILFIGIINENIELPSSSKRSAHHFFVEHK